MLLAEVGHGYWEGNRVRWCKSPAYSENAWNGWLWAIEQYGKALGNCIHFE